MEGIPASNKTIYVDTTNVRVGISTGVATQTLDVHGSVAISSSVYLNGTAGSYGYQLTSSGTGLSPFWAPPSPAGYIYYFTANSDPTGFKQMTSTGQATVSTDTYASAVDGVVISTFITPVNQPGTAQLPSGRYVVHTHAAQTAGTKQVYLYAEVWEANAAGTLLTYIGATGLVGPLTSSDLAYDSVYTAPASYTFAATTSRIVIKIKLNVVGGGSAPTVQHYYGNGDDSHVTLPVNASVLNGYVPYTGATTNVNLGSNYIIASQFGANTVPSTNFAFDSSFSGAAYARLTPGTNFASGYYWGGNKSYSLLMRGDLTGNPLILRDESLAADRANIDTNGGLYWIGPVTTSTGTFLGSGSNYAITTSSGVHFTTTKTGVVWQDGSVSTTSAANLGFLSSVNTNASLTGSGTPASALGVASSSVAVLSGGVVLNSQIDHSSVPFLSGGSLNNYQIDHSSVPMLSGSYINNYQLDPSSVNKVIGVSSACSAGFYWDGGTLRNGVATGGTCVAAAAGSGAQLASTQTFSGANTFTSSVTILTMGAPVQTNFDVLIETAGVSAVSSYQFSAVLSTNVAYTLKYNLSSTAASNLQLQYSGTSSGYYYNITLWQGVTSNQLCSATAQTLCLLTGVNSCGNDLAAGGDFVKGTVELETGNNGSNYSAMIARHNFVEFINYGVGESSCILNVSNANGVPGSPKILISAGTMTGTLELWSHRRVAR